MELREKPEAINGAENGQILEGQPQNEAENVKVESVEHIEAEAPAEEAPAEEAPAEEVPAAEEAPAVEAPAAEAPAAEEVPVEEVPAEEAPAEEAPVEEAPVAEEVSVEEVPAAEEAPAVEEPAAEEPAAEEPAEEAPAEDASAAESLKPERATKADIIARLEALAALVGEEIPRVETDRLKKMFYNIRNAEIEEEKRIFLDKGNEESAFATAPNADEDRVKELLAVIREKREAFREELDAKRRANLEVKNGIIAEIERLSADTDNVNRHFRRVQELREQFRSAGDVPETETSALWKRFQDTVERFYDQFKINKELRDYDFRKNLEQKELFCQEAEKLADETDPLVAFRLLQELHAKWREVGPVDKEHREEIWNRFREASAVVNKRHQAFYEGRKEQEQANEAQKTAICERVEAFNFDELKSYAAWDEMTKKILEAQADWKKIGFASKKMNNALFARFRATCDKFFAMKADFYRSVKDSYAANLEKKIALCEKAEALKDSTEWRKTAEAIAELQKEWRTVGPVVKRHSDAVWQRFQAACDHFFEERKKNTSDSRRAEQANLKAKRAVLAALEAIDPEMPNDEAADFIRAKMAEWKEIGHVPFKEKEKLHEHYGKVIDDLYQRYDMRRDRARMASFEESVSKMEGDDNKLYRERDRLMRVLEQKRQELNTAENNLGFFNVKSASGNSMLNEIERNIARLKDDIDDLQKKIAVIDSKV
ncbi:MAG: DUF349 domain-containing protein [Muribaculaceae bacterium]|nr:DUF349 domain-containing protein [Muribaculaceae bacterium]